MSAYVIFICKQLKSKEHFNQYNRLAREASKGFDIKVRSFYGQVEVLENIAAEGVAILEFVDLAQAQAWYQSEAYQEAKKQRDLAGDYIVLITEGLNIPS
ncbi:DUF1330 domain-containing protein [Acinetobacter rudis]|uniref:DUF1330 domain-containing protein n=1 Tax=Acinetobacter rudis TaxID=632955 RepID=A0AAW8J9S5_9GAMM|nr:DUF1330 domain-containing protein [Acinetobacter rudis]MDQ8936574.1 DUF1330 domain-containing protein [Acinetobacter rudis]MDQ9018835.1 DUF1330 domain-containing protein [Acinetobacter rudis]